ncbi:DnaJ domain protein [compost metagenome]
MDIWTILGIESTKDTSAIKKAYAKLLKVYHPEDDPQGYQKLREAYELAMKWADQPEISDVFDDDEEDWHDDDNWVDDASLETMIENEDELVPSHPVQLLSQRIQELYDDFARRIDPNEWQALMTEDFMWKVEYQKARLNVLILFLEQNHFLPTSVWKVLDMSFGLTENKEMLFERYNKELIDYILKQVNGALELNFDCFVKKGNDFDIEQYLTLRQEAQFKLMDGNLAEAEQCLSEANAIFQDDPDLQLMRAKYYLEVDDVSEAMTCLKLLLALKPDEHEGYLLRARLLCEQGHYEEALKDCEYIEQNLPDFVDQDMIYISMQCKTASGQLKEAWEEYDRYRTICMKMYHFRLNALMAKLRNKKLYTQKYNTHYKVFQKRLRKSNYLSYGWLFFRLSWLYTVMFILTYFIFSFNPLYFYVLFIIWLGSALKTFITAKMFFS